MVRSHQATRGRVPRSKLRTSFAVGLILATALLANVAIGAPGADALGGVYRCPLHDAQCVVHGNLLVPRATVIYGGPGEDRIWGGRGFDIIYGGPGVDRLHNFQAAAGEIHGDGDDICVVGVKPGGAINVTYTGCAKVIYRSSQGHG
jgi:hypothetical protein